MNQGGILLDIELKGKYLKTHTTPFCIFLRQPFRESYQKYYVYKNIIAFGTNIYGQNYIKAVKSITHYTLYWINFPSFYSLAIFENS